MSYPLSTIHMSCFKTCSDGVFRTRYPTGLDPNLPASMAGSAADITIGIAALSTKIQLAGAANDATTGVANLVGFGITSTSPLPAAISGVAYSDTLAGQGGTLPYTWGVTGLPTGLTASGPTLSGTTTNLGTFGLGVTLLDSAGSTPAVAGFNDNEGFPSPGSQPGVNGNPALLTTTLNAYLSAGQSVLGIITSACLGSATQNGNHTSRTVTDTEGNAFTTPVVLQGLSTVAGGNINQSQETDLVWCANVAGNASVYDTLTQTFLPTTSDRDYQAALFLILSGVKSLIGTSGLINQVSLTQGIAAGSNNSVTSGTAVPVTQAQCPCYLIAFTQNISEIGSNNYTPTIGSSMPGTSVAPHDSATFWSFINQAYPNGRLAVRMITTAGNYVAYFNNPSNAAEWFQTVVAIVEGAVQNNVATATLNLTVNAPSNGYDGTIKVSGTTLVNSSNAAILLRGANFSGLEASCAQGYQPWYGSAPNWSYLGTLAMNAVRIPLNAASFLGNSCCTIDSAGTGWVSTTAASADPFGNYIAAVDAAIVAAQAKGCYIFLDLHWSAPSFTFGGVTGHAMPLWQPPFMNATTDLLFWQAVANRYGTQATPQAGINNHGIIFELFNEPYLDDYYAEGPTLYGLMKSGGTLTSFKTNGATTDVAQSWTVLGYQTVLNAIRTIGAQNVIACGGPGYSSAMSGYALYLPTDTLTPKQIVQTWHPYQTGTYPYSDGDVWGQCYPDPNNATAQFDTYAKAVIAAGIPVAITEDGGTYGPAATSGEPHTSFMTNWAVTQGAASYIAWEAWAPVSPAANGENNLITSSNTLTTGQGVVWGAWLAGFTLPEAATPVFSLAAGTYVGAQTLIITDTTPGKTIYYSTNGTTPTTASQIYTAPITVSATETVKAMVTAPGYTQSAVMSALYTITGGGSLPAPTGVQILYQGCTAAGQSTAVSNWYAPGNANSITIQFNTVSGAASYKIYKSTNGGGNVYLTTITALGGSTQTYVDTAAGCVGIQPAPPPQFAAATSYAYYVSAVSSTGVEGALSNQFSWYFYITDSGSLPLRGLFQELSYSATPTYGGSIGASGPCVAVSLTGQYGAWLAALGNSGCNDNIWSGAFNYLCFDLWDPAGGTQYNLVPHVRTPGGDVNDNLFNSSGGNYYATITAGAAGTWVTFKIALATLRKDYRNNVGTNGSFSGGSSITQSSIYKMDFQPQNVSGSYQFGVRNYCLTTA